MTSRTASRVALVVVLLLTALLGGRDLTDPASAMLTADMSRYMMNGVFVYDLIGDGGAWSVDALTTYAERYFARYPALTLGHHPPLPYLAVVPFYAVFGLSVLAARLTALCWFGLAVWSLFLVGRRLFDWRVGAWAAALFATNVMVLRAGQHLLSEMPSTALVLAALAALLAWRDIRRGRDLAGFAAAATASVFAKQLAALLLPVYAIVAVVAVGWRRLATRQALFGLGVGAVLAGTAALMTLDLAPANVALLRDGFASLWSGTRPRSVTAIVATVLTTHLTWPAVIVATTGIAIGLVYHRRRTGLILSWIAAVVVGTAVLLGPVEPARYAFGALPAYYLLAAAPAGAVLPPLVRGTMTVVLAALLCWQGWNVRNVRPTGAGGYEEAARFVVAESRQPVVLYHAISDTGYFVFFVRVHDPDRRLVVLRGEKLLVPPRAGDTTTPAELHDLLQASGVQYVVVEERRAETAALRLLHDELRGDRFVERRRIPVVSREPSARGLDLVVYEYRDARPPAADAEVDIGVWRANRTIRVPMRDLLSTP